MSNAAIIQSVTSLSNLAVGEPGSPTNYSTINKSQSYALPGTVTQEVVLTYSATQSANVFVITGLSHYSKIKLTKTLAAADTVIDTIDGTILAAEDRARETYNVMFWLSSVTSFDELTFTFITGAAYSTGFRSVFVGAAGSAPAVNFDKGAAWDDDGETNTVKTRGSSYSQVVSSLRKAQLTFSKLSDEELLDLKFARKKIGDSNCVLMLDASLVHPEKWALGRITGLSSTLNSNTSNTGVLSFEESSEWL